MLLALFLVWFRVLSWQGFGYRWQFIYTMTYFSRTAPSEAVKNCRGSGRIKSRWRKRRASVFGRLWRTWRRRTGCRCLVLFQFLLSADFLVFWHPRRRLQRLRMLYAVAGWRQTNRTHCIDRKSTRLN